MQKTAGLYKSPAVKAKKTSGATAAEVKNFIEADIGDIRVTRVFLLNFDPAGGK